jgi:hypothetical protein
MASSPVWNSWLMQSKRHKIYKSSGAVVGRKNARHTFGYAITPSRYLGSLLRV